MNCQIFSTGFNLGDFGGNGMSVMLPGTNVKENTGQSHSGWQPLLFKRPRWLSIQAAKTDMSF
jgi:hypothetical protein